MNNKITIIFPCAGEASRFGYTFKPFLNIGDLTFIEKAVQPFEKWEHLISNYHFIFTEQQDDKFSVKKNLRNYFENKNSIDRNAGLEQAKNFSYEKVGEQMMEYINE